MPMSRGIFYCFFLLGCLAAADPGAGQPPAPAGPELDRKIEGLRKQIAELLAAAPAERRDEILRRLLEEPRDESSESTTETEQDEPPAPAPRPILTAPAREKAAQAQEAEPHAQETTPTPPKRRRARRCNTLDFLDENGDGQISAADRHWRHLYLWIDKNRDSARQDKEVVSAYEAGVREISLDLETFTREKGPLGEIRRGEGLLFDLGSNGFGDQRRVDDGLLLVDATGLGRANGPEILGPDQKQIQGLVSWARGWTARKDGNETVLTCP